jgi:hypothetical protein
MEKVQYLATIITTSMSSYPELQEGVHLTYGQSKRFENILINGLVVVDG